MRPNNEDTYSTKYTLFEEVGIIYSMSTIHEILMARLIIVETYPWIVIDHKSIRSFHTLFSVSLLPKHAIICNI